MCRWQSVLGDYDDVIRAPDDVARAVEVTRTGAANDRRLATI